MENAKVETKFTPGPWYYGEDGFNLGNGVVLKRDGYGQSGQAIATISRWGEEQQANARLIAAAPEMYDALKGLAGAVASMRMLTALPDSITEEIDKQLANSVMVISKATQP